MSLRCAARLAMTMRQTSDGNLSMNKFLSSSGELRVPNNFLICAKILWGVDPLRKCGIKFHSIVNGVGLGQRSFDLQIRAIWVQILKYAADFLQISEVKGA